MTIHTAAAPLDAAPQKAANNRLIDAPLAKALLSILLVIGGRIAIGNGLQALGPIEVAGYEMIPSIWATGITAALVLAWVKLTRGNVASLGLTRPKSYWRSTVFGIMGAVGMLLVLLTLLTFLVSLGMVPPIKEGATALMVSGPSLAITLTLSLVAVWINAAIGEELLFRGYMMNNVHNALGTGWKAGLMAALIVSFVFGAVHVPSQGLYGLVATGLAGMMLGGIFLMGKRTLFPVIIVHGVVDTIAIVGEGLGAF